MEGSWESLAAGILNSADVLSHDLLKTLCLDINDEHQHCKRFKKIKMVTAVKKEERKKREGCSTHLLV